MRHIIYLFILAIVVFVSIPEARAVVPDSLNYAVPQHFTANRGQWDDRVRYAIIGSNSSVWFCDDEIVIERPVERKTVKMEHPDAGDEAQTEIIRIKFTDMQSGHALRALDTLEGVANFYRGNDRKNRHAGVSTHSCICYEGLPGGAQLELHCSQRGMRARVNAGMEGMSSALEVRNGSPLLAKHAVATVTGSGDHISAWLNCDLLASYLAWLGDPDGNLGETEFRQATAEGPRIVLSGISKTATFPVRNAYQSSNRGEQDVVITCFDAQRKRVVYSTYLGSRGGDGIRRQYFGYGYGSGTLKLKGGKTYMALGGDGNKGFPIVRNLSGSSLPPINLPDSSRQQAVLAVLDSSGGLEASTFLGGPGHLGIWGMQVVGDKIYVAGLTSGNLDQITPDAVEPIAPSAGFNPGNVQYCGYFAVVSATLDTLVYGSYIDPVTEQGGGYTVNQTQGGIVTVSPEDNSVLIAFGKAWSDRNKTPLVHPVMTKDDLHEVGAYMVKLTPDLQDYVFATCFGFPDREFLPGKSFIDRNGNIYLAGEAGRYLDTTAIPGTWHHYNTEGAVTQSSLVVAKFSSTGQLLGGLDLASFGYPVCQSIEEGLCHDIVLTGSLDGGYNPLIRLTLLNPHDTTYMNRRVPGGARDQFIVSFDGTTMLPNYSTLWNYRYVRDTQVAISNELRPNGYMLFASQFLHGTPDAMHEWHMLGPDVNYGWCAADIRIPTPCWTILCDIQTRDTLRIERRRGYAVPPEFDVQYEVSNASALREAQILQALIEAPPGFELVSGQPAQPMTPALITPGRAASCSWRLRLRDGSSVGDTALIRCRVMYYDPESGETYPAAEELCEKDMVIVRFDEPEKNIVCTVDGPDSLFWTGSGFTATAHGVTGPIRYTATYTNLEADTVVIDTFTFRAGDHCRILGSAVLPGVHLAPGASNVLHVDVEAKALRYARTIRVEAEARDVYDIPISACAAETHVPGVRDLPCAVTGPAQIRWYPKSGLAYPGLLTLTLHLDNPLDTVRAGVRTWIDTSSAPHVSLAPGDSASRPPVDIAEGGTYEPYWRFVLARPPSSNASDTIRFIYEADGVQYACVYVITIDVILIEKSVICDLMGTDSLSIAQIQAREQAQLHYALTNTGTVKVDVDRYELAIIPATGFPEAGLVSLDPLVRAGGSIDPGDDITMDWNLHALILRASRAAECTVTAYDANDSVLAVCTHTIALEGLDGLICTMTATDSVHFNRAELRYEPEKITASFSLENLLDTVETNIEAVIDLTKSPRVVLAPSETASKAISVLDSHSTANLTWLLIPQPASTAEDQEVIVRYRSDEQTEWKQCSVIVHIEAWPEETGIACATGGHDSLYADPYYERFIPDPLFVSYTVTNTGTIALTGCEASIILPSEFVLDGSDSTQLFTSPEFMNQQGGPVSPGTLLPNASCTRWWMITPSNQLTAAGPVNVTWQWYSDQQGSGDGCSSSIEVVFDSPTGIVLSPKHLYFEAERGGPIPAAQNVLLWTGGGMTIPWTIQPSETWLNANPLSGNLEATVAVQPNSTMLDVGGHTAALNVSATPSNRSIAVTYVIRKSTGVDDPSIPAALTLEAWPQPVAIGGMLQVAIPGAGDESYRLSLCDLLGRERLSRTLEAGEQWSISVSGTQFTPGSYILRVTTADGAQVSKLISVIR